MDKLVGVVSMAPKTRSKNDDDFADRLSSRYTVVLLIVFAVLVGIIEVGQWLHCQSLHWLPVQQRHVYKSAVITYKLQSHKKSCHLHRLHHISVFTPSHTSTTKAPRSSRFRCSFDSTRPLPTQTASPSTDSLAPKTKGTRINTTKRRFTVAPVVTISLRQRPLTISSVLISALSRVCITLLRSMRNRG